MSQALAVAIHDVDERTLRRCAGIRDWLERRGVDRVTLLVIPERRGATLAPDGELAAWLGARVAKGDVLAQHGCTHECSARPRGARGLVARAQGGRAAEFSGLTAYATQRSVRRGLRVLSEAGLPVRGFVAPAYVYTPALRRELRELFDWWATLGAVHMRDRTLVSPALCLGASTPLKRALSPATVRAAARVRSPLMRVDVHPADFDHRRNLQTIEELITRARTRAPVTYDDLLAT